MLKQILVIAFVIITQASYGQVSKKTIAMSNGEYAGLELILPVQIKAAEKLWKEYTKPYGKIDWDKKNKEYKLSNAHISSISSSAISIITRFDQNGNQTKASFLLQSGTAFMNEENYPEELNKAILFLQEFIHESERYKIREELKKEEEKLSRLKKDMEKLINKNKDLHKDIDNAKKLIIQKEREVQVNIANQEQNQRDTQLQRDAIREITQNLSLVGKGNKQNKQ